MHLNLEEYTRLHNGYKNACGFNYNIFLIVWNYKE